MKKHNGGPRRKESQILFAVTHGATKTKAFSVWASMKARCLYPSASGYERYGGAGVTVCERWMTFANFLADMGQPPPGYSLDRIDNAKGYSPSNCRWVPKADQVKNTKRTVWVEINGNKMCLKDAAKLLGICRFKLRRIVAGLEKNET